MTRPMAALGSVLLRTFVKIFSCSLFLGSPAYARAVPAEYEALETPAVCGRYLVWGQIRREKGNLHFYLNEGSLSQVDFTFEMPARLSVVHLENKTIEALIDIKTPGQGPAAKISGIEKIRIRAPDPLGLSTQPTLKLLSLEDCAKKL